MLRTLLSVVAATAIAIASPQVLAQQQRLLIATEGTLPPWNMTGADGRLIGFEVDLAGDLCRRMNIQCEIVPHEWDGILPGLQQGLYDAVMGGVSITAERERAVDFSTAYAADPAIFAVLADAQLARKLPAVEKVDLNSNTPRTAIPQIADALQGRTVGVIVSTTHARMMETLLPHVAVKAYDRIDNAIIDLLIGRVDAVLSARSTLENAAQKEPGRIATVGPAFFGGPLGRGVGVAVRKGSGLSARFSAAIAEAAQDGTASRLSVKWFGFDATGAMP
ncbi:ABC transporter, substrate-binding protein (cluster 3, basic aa/glutamine/opines) [Azospirillum argentinense]|uniref:transporter substrate-binding domain-containing protein n=1 Tax=Azospirillum argentinense TaxID=2970906 RepID=UPI0032DFB471